MITSFLHFISYLILAAIFFRDCIIGQTILLFGNSFKSFILLILIELNKDIIVRQNSKTIKQTKNICWNIIRIRSHVNDWSTVDSWIDFRHIVGYNHISVSVLAQCKPRSHFCFHLEHKLEQINSYKTNTKFVCNVLMKIWSYCKIIKELKVIAMKR